MELNDIAEYRADRLNDARKRFNSIRITGICVNCAHSHIFKTNRTNDPTVLCTRNERPFQVALDITECNKFSQIGVLDVWDLAKLASPVDLDKKKLGFGVEESK
jgi:hypothetical protein